MRIGGIIGRLATGIHTPHEIQRIKAMNIYTLAKIGQIGVVVLPSCIVQLPTLPCVPGTIR